MFKPDLVGSKTFGGHRGERLSVQSCKFTVDMRLPKFTQFTAQLTLIILANICVQHANSA